MREKPPSVNYHLWEPCNMRCRFCFATFQDVVSTVLPRGHLGREDSLRIIKKLAPSFRKITFAGGEPTLCPWLFELFEEAKRHGTTTMLVTNGSRLDEEYINKLSSCLDWLVLSIDSASERTHVELGRAVRKRAIPSARYEAVANMIRESNIRLKVNTVVTSLNAGEDISPLITALRPERWKILRALPVEGQNSGKIEPLLCSDAQFAGFVERHRWLESTGITVVAEDNEDMRGSYAMVDPAGRFFDNVSGAYRYSSSILQVGVEAAWSEIEFSMEHFDARGGNYAF